MFQTMKRLVMTVVVLRFLPASDRNPAGR